MSLIWPLRRQAAEPSGLSGLAEEAALGHLTSLFEQLETDCFRLLKFEHGGRAGSVQFCSLWHDFSVFNLLRKRKISARLYKPLEGRVNHDSRPKAGGAVLIG